MELNCSKSTTKEERGLQPQIPGGRFFHTKKEGQTRNVYRKKSVEGEALFLLSWTALKKRGNIDVGWLWGGRGGKRQRGFRGDERGKKIGFWKVQEEVTELMKMGGHPSEKGKDALTAGFFEKTCTPWGGGELRPGYSGGTEPNEKKTWGKETSLMLKRRKKTTKKGDLAGEVKTHAG